MTRIVYVLAIVDVVFILFTLSALAGGTDNSESSTVTVSVTSDLSVR